MTSPRPTKVGVCALGTTFFYFILYQSPYKDFSGSLPCIFMLCLFVYILLQFIYMLFRL